MHQYPKVVRASAAALALAMLGAMLLPASASAGRLIQRTGIVQLQLRPGSWVTINPQPLPPRPGTTVTINPQPLPPRPGATVTINPQPLPPKIGTSARGMF